MSELVITADTRVSDLPHRALRAAAAFWFAVAAVGHWIFLVYILGVFGPPIMSQGLEGLGETHLPEGFIEGDWLGNLAAAAHVLLAAVIIGGGPLQLIPQIRGRYPAFHRWLGRSYVVSAMLSAMAGLYMVWARGSVGDLNMQVAISGDGVLILVFGVLAVRHAMARDLVRHRRWAMRLFMVASAVWFFRVGLMAWVMLTGGAGVDFDTFSGPFIYAWSYAQYLLPLAMLEAYLRIRSGGSATARWTLAVALIALTVVMGLGIFAATMGMWLPRL